MATYYDIFGQKAQYLSSDPANLTKGQVWYNSTSNTAKIRGFNAAAFTTSATQNRPTDPSDGSQSNSVYNDAIKAGGRGTGAPSTNYGVNWTESWDGSSWTNESNRPWPAWGGGAGGPPSYFINAGGYSAPGTPSGTPNTSTNKCAVWTGSAWTSLPNLNPAGKNSFSIIGTATAAITTAGYIYGGPVTGAVANTEEWNGSTWSANVDFPAAVYKGNSGFGSSTSSAYQAGGYPGPYNTTMFEYDGTSWTVMTATLPTLVSTATGTPDNAIAFYQPGASALWDGTSWAANPITGGYTPPAGLNSSGNGSKAIVWMDSYNHPTDPGKTFIWEDAEVATQTITTS